MVQGERVLESYIALLATLPVSCHSRPRGEWCLVSDCFASTHPTCFSLPPLTSSPPHSHLPLNVHTLSSIYFLNTHAPLPPLSSLPALSLSSHPFSVLHFVDDCIMPKAPPSISAGSSRRKTDTKRPIFQSGDFKVISCDNQTFTVETYQLQAWS